MSASDARAGPDWQLAAAPARARGWLFALVAVLPVVLVVVTLAAIAEDRGHGPWLVPAAGVALASGVAWYLLDRVLRRHRVEVDDTGLVVRTTFYSRRFLPGELQLDKARTIVLAERPEFRPMLKTNGFALPGFASGWFRLRNGSRALVAMAGGPRVVLIPTARDHVLLLEPRRPAALLDRLSVLATAHARR